MQKNRFLKSNKILCTYGIVLSSILFTKVSFANQIVSQASIGASLGYTGIYLKVGETDFSTGSPLATALNIDALIWINYLLEMNYTLVLGQSSILLQGPGAHLSWVFWGEERRFRETADTTYELSQNFAARLGVGVAYYKYDLSSTVSEITIGNESSSKDFLAGNVVIPEIIGGVSFGLWGPISLNTSVRASLPSKNADLNLTIQTTSAMMGLKYTL